MNTKKDLSIIFVSVPVVLAFAGMIWFLFLLGKHEEGGEILILISYIVPLVSAMSFPFAVAAFILSIKPKLCPIRIVSIIELVLCIPGLVFFIAATADGFRWLEMTKNI